MIRIFKIFNLVLVILLALTLYPSVTTSDDEDYNNYDFNGCDLEDNGQRCWLADRTKYGDGVKIVYADTSDASCPGLRRQKSKRILEECKTDKADYCCICKAYLDKHGVFFKEGCANISAPPFEGRGEVCMCKGNTQDYKERLHSGDKRSIGCNAKGLGVIDFPADGCGFPGEEEKGGKGTVISREALFLTLLAAIIFMI